MKTSNKLLLVLFLAIFFSAASLMLYAKSQMILVDGNLDDMYFGNGPIVEQTILDDLSLNSIEMGDNFKYTIDPTRTDITIKGDSAFISKLTYVSTDKFRILTGGVGHNFDWPDNILVTVGTKNLNMLDLDINGNATVVNTSPMTLSNVGMQINGNGRCTLDLEVENLNVDVNGNGKFTINGSNQNLEAQISGNGKMYFENCTMQAAKMNLSGNARFYGDIITDLNANASGNAKGEFNEVNGVQAISTSGNARFTIRN